MGATTHKASNAPRNRTPSHKRRDNDVPATAPAPKRAKTVVFVNPEQISSDPPYIDEEPVSDAINEPEDVSMQEYTLATSIMLDAISIYGDTSFWKLGEFQYRKFEVDSIKRLDKATLKSKTKFEWSTGCATLGAKGVTKANELKVVVDEASGWGKVESFIQHWMRLHRRDITVKLVLHYALQLEDIVESDGEAEPIKKGKKV
jgi:hypothetical protein